MANCGQTEDRRSDEFYEDTCELHPFGCHTRVVALGVEVHDTPAYKRPPTPGALEAEAFAPEIAETEMKLLALRVNRQLAHDEAFQRGAN